MRDLFGHLFCPDLAGPEAGKEAQIIEELVEQANGAKNLLPEIGSRRHQRCVEAAAHSKKLLGRWTVSLLSLRVEGRGTQRGKSLAGVDA